MEWLKRKTGWVSVLLMAPALFLCGAGILHTGFGRDGANRFLELVLSMPVVKAVLSPVTVLGGTVAAFILNARQIMHLSADRVHEEFVVALSIKRTRAGLLRLALAAGLLLLLAGYGWVEHFKVVAR